MCETCRLDAVKEYGFLTVSLRALREPVCVCVLGIYNPGPHRYPGIYQQRRDR